MGETYGWYSMLVKPEWAPPSWLFGPAWTLLYILIAISFGSVFYLVIKNKLPKSVALPFVLNLFFNFLFTPIQFGLRNNILASIDILAVLITIIWMFKTIWPHYRWVVLINIPYLMWVSFATVLQLTITYLNLK
ncbi:MAG TPA: tryptophan-rich sensory protein [Candidatus Woesebacteria bacterium]|nr:tryptophan-rich sensory protein [Candidatus Woesebacteria bacterium]